MIERLINLNMDLYKSGEDYRQRAVQEMMLNNTNNGNIEEEENNGHIEEEENNEVMEEEEVYINSMMSMSRQQFIALNEDDEKKQLSPSQWAVKSEPATVSQFPRSYSHDEIDEEIFHTLCMNEMEIS